MKSECDTCQRDKSVTLQIGGEAVCTYCERYRHECEARHVCRLATREARREYIDSVTKHRGPDAGRQLEQTARKLWSMRDRK